VDQGTSAGSKFPGCRCALILRNARERRGKKPKAGRKTANSSLKDSVQLKEDGQGKVLGERRGEKIRANYEKISPWGKAASQRQDDWKF